MAAPVVARARRRTASSPAPGHVMLFAFLVFFLCDYWLFVGGSLLCTVHTRYVQEVLYVFSRPTNLCTRTSVAISTENAFHVFFLVGSSLGLSFSFSKPFPGRLVLQFELEISSGFCVSWFTMFPATYSSRHFVSQNRSAPKEQSRPARPRPHPRRPPPHTNPRTLTGKKCFCKFNQLYNQQIVNFK